MLPNGDLATACESNAIKIWNINDGSLKKSIEGHTDIVWAIAILQNANNISGPYDSTIKIWSENWELLKSLTQHTDKITSLAVFQNGNFASGSCDKTIIIWARIINK